LDARSSIIFQRLFSAVPSSSLIRQYKFPGRKPATNTGTGQRTTREGDYACIEGREQKGDIFTTTFCGVVPRECRRGEGRNKCLQNSFSHGAEHCRSRHGAAIGRRLREDHRRHQLRRWLAILAPFVSSLSRTEEYLHPCKL
jgi:hypothetical protein